MSAVYTYTETYNGSEILIEVERDVDTITVGDETFAIHQISAFIDEVETISEPGTTRAHPPVYKNMKGSEAILDYIVTSPTTGHVQHDWTADLDIASLEIDEATLSDYSDAVNIHEGTLTAPINDGGYTSGSTMYFRIRGTRSGESPGPWMNRTIIVS